ncbi:MAG: EAL domain-containing protein [Bacillota bacterium]
MKSIKTKGIIFIFSILVTVLITILLISHNFIKQWAIDEKMEDIKMTTKSTRNLTERYISNYVFPIKELSKVKDIKSMDWEKQRKVLKEQKGLDYLTLAIVNKEGMAYYPNGNILDLSDRGYIKKSLKGEFNISPVLTSRVTHNPVMMIAQPIYKDKKVVGSLIARINPKFLTDFIGAKSSEVYNIYFVLNDLGNIVLHSENGYKFRNYNFLTFKESDFGFNGLKSVVKKSYNSDSGFGSFTKDNEKIYVGYSNIESLNWRFFLGFYEKNALKNLKHLDFIFIMIGLICTILLAMIAWFITKSFTKPVINLSNLFEKAANGDLTVRSDYKKDDELGKASKSFNKMMKKIQELTYFDPVTDLKNEQVLRNEFKENIEFNKNNKKNIMIIQIKKFSKINEMFGYKKGDLLLKSISKKLLDILPDDAILYRGKGEQFVVFFPIEISNKDLKSIGEEIVNKIKGPVNIQNDTLTTDLKIGISQFPKNGVEIENLIKKAVFASNSIINIKEKNIQFFKDELYDENLEIQNLIKKIKKAIDEDEMFLKYQPIYNLEDMDIKEMEVLIRWEDPEKGLISPGKFIPVAEENNLISQIDFWVLKKAMSQMQKWKKSGIPLVPVSINISSETFEKDNFENYLEEVSTYFGIDPNLIQLELTERTFLNNIEKTIKKFTRLRKKGFKIAIDDFGVGYSSLSYLVRLPIDHLKIDRSFIKNINKSNEAKVIISTLVDMGNKLGVEVISEGIEIKEELDYLMDIKCDNGQGYLMNKPLDTKDIENVLTEK